MCQAETVLKSKVFDKIRNQAVIFNWLDAKIDELNDSHKDKADRLRKVLYKRETILKEKVNNMSFMELIEKLY